MQIARDLTKRNLEQHAKDAKAYHDQKARERKYKPGDRVWLDNPAHKPGLSKKLESKYIGPYYISDRGRKDTYRLRLCENNKPHPSRQHAVRLKAYNPRIDPMIEDNTRKDIVQVLSDPASNNGLLRAKVKGKSHPMRVSRHEIPNCVIRRYYIKRDIQAQKRREKRPPITN